MKRFLGTDLSLARIKDAVVRRVMDIPHAIAWRGHSRLAGINRSRLMQFKDAHQGERCFILGNGPSLKRMDLSPLKHEATFGLNRIYLLFGELAFTPTYYACVNELVLEQFASDIRSLRMPKFLNWNRRNHFSTAGPNTNFINLGLTLRDGFNRDVSRPFYSGGTVTYVALQLAFIMGFSEVILIGVDHSFTDKGIPNRVETRQSTVDVNHFHPDYFPKGVKWQLPDLKRSEIAYSLAREVFEADGRRVYDATVGGECQVFEKIDFLALF